MKTARLAPLVLSLVLLACEMSARDAAVNSANAIQIAGELTGAAIDRCAVVMERDRAQSEQIARDPGAPTPVRLTPEHFEAIASACEELGRAYDLVERAHTAIREAAKVADEMEKAGGKPDWGAISSMILDGLAAAEALRKAEAAAREVVP
jgi:hypothetical protein